MCPLLLPPSSHVLTITSTVSLFGLLSLLPGGPYRLPSRTGIVLLSCQLPRVEVELEALQTPGVGGIVNVSETQGFERLFVKVHLTLREA